MTLEHHTRVRRAWTSGLARALDRIFLRAHSARVCRSSRSPVSDILRRFFRGIVALSRHLPSSRRVGSRLGKGRTFAREDEGTASSVTSSANARSTTARSGSAIDGHLPLSFVARAFLGYVSETLGEAREWEREPSGGHGGDVFVVGFVESSSEFVFLLEGDDDEECGESGEGEPGGAVVAHEREAGGAEGHLRVSRVSHDSVGARGDELTALAAAFELAAPSEGDGEGHGAHPLELEVSGEEDEDRAAREGVG